MKFVALVSGGKDSCFNIMHCIKAGHELVGMINFRPKSTRPEEIDSYMFQTVGFRCVEYISELSKVPLFTAEISENEDLVIDEMALMFSNVKKQLNYEGISAGAIGSSYQQSRVDKACQMAKVVPLTYLWLRDQCELLDEIVNSNLDARVIKVAGMGLNKHHLGKSLKELQPELLNLHHEFGLHPCGEGGEYETMVLDAPFFHHEKLQFTSTEIVQHSQDDVYYLKFDVKRVSRPDFSSQLSTPTLEIPLNNKRLRTVSNGFKPNYKFEVREGVHNGLVLDNTGEVSCSQPCISIRNSGSGSGGGVGHGGISTICNPNPDTAQKTVDVNGLNYVIMPCNNAQAQTSYGITYLSNIKGIFPSNLEIPESVENEARLGLFHAYRILNFIHESPTNWTFRLAIVIISSNMYTQLVRELWNEISNLPLIIIEQLPEDTNEYRIQWVFQAVDQRYFKYFIPEIEDEDFYSDTPELYLSTNGYEIRTGFETLKIETTINSDSKLVLTNQECGDFSAYMFKCKQAAIGDVMTDCISVSW